jgi:hypothetical protein
MPAPVSIDSGVAEMTIGNVLMLVILLFFNSTQAQTTQSAKREDPVITSVCEILENPSAFNNKLVEVRGYVSVGFEDSTLHSESCSGEIWFALADGSGPPGLAMTVNGLGKPGGSDSNRSRKQPIAISLIRDANFEKFESYLSASTYRVPLAPCGPDCHRYQVTATFTGRIDAVSNEIHAAHLKKPRSKPSDFKGYGQMGLFDAQLVVESMKQVEAVDLAHPRLVK